MPPTSTDPLSKAAPPAAEAARAGPPTDFSALIERLGQLVEALGLLIEQRPPPAAAPPPPPVASPWLNAKEVAALLHASLRSIRNWSHSGEIPKPVRIGAARRWLRADIEAHVARKKTRRGKKKTS